MIAVCHYPVRAFLPKALRLLLGSMMIIFGPIVDCCISKPLFSYSLFHIIDDSYYHKKRVPVNRHQPIQLHDNQHLTNRSRSFSLQEAGSVSNTSSFHHNKNKSGNNGIEDSYFHMSPARGDASQCTFVDTPSISINRY